MEEHVNGVLETFFRGLIDNYLMQSEKESFLYRAFWRKNVAGLLTMLDEATLNKEKIFPGLLKKLEESFRQLPENRLPREENKAGNEGRLDFYNMTSRRHSVPSLKNQRAGSRASLRWTLSGGIE